MVIFIELDKRMDCFFCVYIIDKWKKLPSLTFPMLESKKKTLYKLVFHRYRDW